MREANRWNDRMLCPRCKDQWTHLVSVKAYFRKEDADVGNFVEASHACVNASTSASMQDCPSGRRDGVSLGFDCERCQVVEVLHITQHKGETYFFWENGYPAVEFNDGTIA